MTHLSLSAQNFCVPKTGYDGKKFTIVATGNTKDYITPDLTGGCFGVADYTEVKDTAN